MNFIIVDLILLVLFALFVTIFLYRKRENLYKEGALYLYKTQLGVKIINYVGGKYKKTLKVLSYVSMGIGYFLMIGIVYFMLDTTYKYLTTNIASIIKAPPLAPLIPYFPKLFGLESYFPPFYFIYFVLALIIVATVHEFSHGIFARRYGINIKSTGFAFLKYFPALFGAFVEQDDKQMQKANKFEQMSVLSAGTFANVLTAILFYVLLFLFFTLTFTATGVVFNEYPAIIADMSIISSIGGISVENITYNNLLESVDEEGLKEVQVENQTYLINKELLEDPRNKGVFDAGFAILYYDAPAINAGLGNIITEINSVKIDSHEKLSEELMKYSPGEQVEIKTIEDKESVTYEIILGEHPEEEGRVWLGVGFYDNSRGFTQKLMGVFPTYKKPHVYYETENDVNEFIKDLLWWIFIINILVALFNMLPLGILDGGRFFYLTILSITKKEKIADKSFKAMTWFILLIFLVLMIKWVAGFVF